MKELAIRLWQPRVRISSLLTISLMAMLFCFIDLPIVFVGLIELVVLTGCVVLFRKVDVTQYELFQYKPHWFWRICEWYWTIYFCYWVLPFMKWLGNCYPTLKYAYFVYPSIFKPLTDWAILLYGKEVAVPYLSAMMFTPILILSMPICYYCFRWLFKQVAEFFKSLTRFEIGYLTISSAILITILLVISAKTSYFVYPVNKDLYIGENSQNILFKYIDGDAFFDSDNFFFSYDPRYSIRADGFRHPFFSLAFLFFMPLMTFWGQLIHVFFSSFHYSFAIGIAVVQIMLYFLTALFIFRIYSSIISRSFCTIVLSIFTCSFPMIFVLLPETYIFSLFYLVIVIYFIINQTIHKKSFILSILAIFSTSLSLIPIVFAHFLYNKWRTIIFFVICLSMVLIGRNLIFNHTHKDISQCFLFTSETTPIKNMVYFNQFLTSNVILPSWKCEQKIITYIDKEKAKQFVSIWFTQKTGKMFDTIFGIIILLLCLLSYILYHRYDIIKISFVWFVTSFLLIGIIGFGYNYKIYANCNVLYCSYFSWAIIPLTLLPFYQLWQKFPKLPIPQALYAFAAYLAISNLYFLYQVVQIVSDRYIVPPGM